MLRASPSILTPVVAMPRGAVHSARFSSVDNPWTAGRLAVVPRLPGRRREWVEGPMPRDTPARPQVDHPPWTAGAVRALDARGRCRAAPPAHTEHSLGDEVSFGFCSGRPFGSRPLGPVDKPPP